MNALVRPAEDQTADLWAAIQSRDLHAVNRSLRNRLRDELNDEPPEPRWNAYDEETGLPKQGPL